MKLPVTQMDIDTIKTVFKVGPELPLTFSLGTKLKEHVQKKLKDTWKKQPEEDKKDSSVKETMPQRCPRTDPQYVLHSQNPAECASVNTLTGITNGFPQRGVLKSKHKIRVDFKVSILISQITSSHQIYNLLVF